MKTLIAAAVLFVGSSAMADCCEPCEVRTYRCVSPCDMFRASCGYIGNTTVGVFKGLGDAVTAPFRTPICIEPRVYEVRRPRWVRIPGYIRRIR